MRVDNFRLPITLNQKIINSTKRIDKIRIAKFGKSEIDSILLIERNNDHYFTYKNSNNDDCCINYSYFEDNETSEYDCKVSDPMFGSYEESILENKNDNDIVYEIYKNENLAFAYEKIGNHEYCAISNKKAEIIHKDSRTIILDSYQNYSIFDSPIISPKIIEEGTIGKCSSYHPLLVYSYSGDNLITINNIINKSNYMVYLE